jgi:hypothetical protein
MPTSRVLLDGVRRHSENADHRQRERQRCLGYPRQAPPAALTQQGMCSCRTARNRAIAPPAR